MKKQNYLLFILSIFILSSCNPNQVYKEYDRDFENYQWEKGKVIEFVAIIEDIHATYECVFSFRHVYGFNHAQLPFLLNIQGPNSKSNHRYVMSVMKADNTYFSDCSGDYCDIDMVLEPEMHFTEPGKYQFTIQYDIPIEKMENVMAAGIILNKNETPIKKDEK